ncbi:MAG: hypothetical protein K2X81_21235 [Candidatus Obscuribacterales bacterium]|nr:hypothetical protein [Candidatus Obscuribacterales bacterium]
MDITVIKRECELEFSTLLPVGLGETERVSVRKFYAAEANDVSRLAGFMDQLLNGGDFDACFEALDEQKTGDAESRLQQVMNEGKTKLLAKCRKALMRIAQRGRDAQAVLDSYEGLQFNVTVLEAPEGHGICSVCLKTFRQHCIGGTRNICMDHINPGFI